MRRASTCMLSRVEVLGAGCLLGVLAAIQFPDGLGMPLEHAIPDRPLFRTRDCGLSPAPAPETAFAIVRAYSATFPNPTTQYQSVRLCHAPSASFHDCFVATESVATSVPLVV